MIRKIPKYVAYRFHSYKNDTWLDVTMLRYEILLFGILLYYYDNPDLRTSITGIVDFQQYAPIVKEFNRRNK